MSTASNPAPRKKFPLGEKYANFVLSHQETQCIELALKGKTTPGIAAALELSPRTVEYYFEKMRRKLRCQTKSELMKRVAESDFSKSGN